MRGTTLWPILVLITLFGLVPESAAQFNSGSTGADGPLNVGTLCPDPVCNLQIRDEPNHVFNYTTINVPAGKTLRFLRNAQNSPAILLATGNVTIAGTIDVSGSPGNSTTIGGSRTGGLGGPGAYDGGGGGFSIAPFFNGTAGAGPGGGFGGGTPNTPTGTAGGGAGHVIASQGQIYGTKTIVPLIGGSGGGGGSGTAGARGCGGGGGGGGILIASSTAMSFTSGAQILAQGGAGFATPLCSGTNQNGGGGSGGAVRFIANSMTGPVTFRVDNPQHGNSGGRVRLESSNFSGLSPTVIPNSPDNQSLSTPNPVFPIPVPSLTITSIGGQNVTTRSNSPHGNPDLTIPQSLPNPVVITVTGQNVPVGTFVRFVVSPQFGASSVTKGTPLTGTIGSSTASDTVNLPNGLTLITALAEFDVTNPLSGYAPIYVEGERVQRMQVSATANGKSEVTYITVSGRQVKAEK